MERGGIEPRYSEHLARMFGFACAPPPITQYVKKLLADVTGNDPACVSRDGGVATPCSPNIHLAVPAGFEPRHTRVTIEHPHQQTLGPFNFANQAGFEPTFPLFTEDVLPLDWSVAVVAGFEPAFPPSLVAFSPLN